MLIFLGHILAWLIVGGIILGALYWIGVFIVCIYHDFKGTPSTGNGAADVIDRYLGNGKSYNVHIDITTEKNEDAKE